jgi:signal transduction histidine kinase
MRYRSFVALSMRWNFWMLLVLAMSVAGGAVAQNADVAPRKVVRQYALTSANDFQQRDPFDWRLQASNDGGKNWVTLDRRKGELFTARHQRRVFKLANTNAYNVYRLQIDLVREPRAANCVQLAEVEVMGESPEDFGPMPLFCDRITTQGDNPPQETVAHLFDGRVESKWLDRPVERETCASWVQWQYVSATGTVISNLTQLRSLQARAEAGYNLRLEAVYAGRTSAGGVAVMDDSGMVELRGLAGLAELPPGQRVLIEGVSEWHETQVGVKEGRVTRREPPAATAPQQIAPEQPLDAKADFEWAVVEGEVQFRQRIGDWVLFDLQDDERTLRVRLLQKDAGVPLPAAGSFVRVTGICRGGYNERGNWVAATLWVSRREAVVELDARPGGVGELPRARAVAIGGLTKLGEIRRMTQNEVARRPYVKVRGIVTGLLGSYLQDDTGGIMVAFKPEDSRRISELGAYIEMEGWLGFSDVAVPVVSADRVVVLGRGKLPQPKRLSWGQLASGRMDAQWVEMEGVVRTTDGAHLLLDCDGRQVTASIAAAAAPAVNRLLDAAVRVRGVGVAALDDWGRMQGVHLLIPSLENLEVESEPVAAFTQPLQLVNNILKVRGPGEAAHRVRVSGVLTFQDGQRLFLQDESGAAMAIFKQEIVLDSVFGRAQWMFWRTPGTNVSKTQVKLEPGDRVEVVGFADSHGYAPVLMEAQARKVGRGGEVKPYILDANGLNNWRRDSMLVQLDAQFVGQQVLGAHTVLELVAYGRALQAFVPLNEGPSEDFQPGTRLRITGVWQMDPVPYAELGRRVGAVRILARSPADFVVLSKPSWWTVERALAVIGGMAFVLLAASVWITQLHRKVEQRSIQLSAEIHRREQMEHLRALEEERARIARDLHDDLGAALTQIRFLSAVESRDQAVPQGTRDQLHLVSEKSRQLVASLDEIVWAINPANDSLPSLLNYLCHVAAEFFASTPIRCRLDMPDALPAVTLTSETRHHLYLAVREALNNIAKHSWADEVWLRFHWQERQLEIVIEDNGRGFSPAEAMQTGEGLGNMRKRVEKIGGQFACDSQPGKGTVCRIRLPMK